MRITGVTLLMIGVSTASAAVPPSNEKRPLVPAAMPGNAVVTPKPGATPVAVDYAMLATLRPQETIRLSVSPTVELPAVVTRVETRSATRFSVFGRIDGDPDSYFILSVVDGAMAGIIEGPSLPETIGVTYLTEGVSQIAPFQQRTALECGLKADTGPAARQPTGQTPSHIDRIEDAPRRDEGGIAGGCPTEPERFDVIIAYTVPAMNEAGGRSAIQALAQNAVDQANQVYEDSQIDPRMTLLFTKQVPYIESANIANDRDRLADPNDNQMDELHSDRNEFGADFVCLFVAAVDTGAAGIAFCTPSGPEEGFCVVQQGQATFNKSFVHEIGHLQGCAHDFANAGIGCNETCYAYGWRFFGNSGRGFRTIMAYDNNAGDYTRIGKFSNPNVNHDGQPTGNDNNPCIVNENNARLINNTALSRESWRAPKFDVWVEAGTQAPFEGTFRFPKATVASGVSAVYGGTRTALVQPELHIKSGTYDEAMTISKPMTIRSCGGDATIGR